MKRLARKEKERQFRREHVMEAADELFGEKGLEGSSMDDIAGRAELSKSTLYTLFSSKDELLCAMHLRDARVGFELLKEAAAISGSGAQKLLAYGRAFFRFYSENPDKLLLRSSQDLRGLDRARISADLEAESAEHNEREAELLRGLVVAGQADGSVDPGLDVDMVMSHFIYTLHPIAKQALFSTHRFASFDGDVYFETYLRFFVNGLRPQPSRNSP